MSEAGESLKGAIHAVRSRIENACRRAERDPAGIVLVAVTKGVPLELVREARAQGIADFGENFAGELAGKAVAVPATWHFMGKVQYGTAARVASHADVVHSAEPGRGLRRVAARAEEAGRDVACLVQVDFTGRRQGVDPEEVESSVRALRMMPGIRTVGLMTMPPWAEDPEEARPFFVRLCGLRDRLREEWPDLQELSMGMSADFDVAVEEGATMLRVGTALFGPRSAATMHGGATGR